MRDAKQISTENPSNALAQNFTAASLLRFAFPTIFMMIFMGLYTMIDTIFVARFVNTYALSAINIVVPILNLTVGLAGMLAAGGSAVIARMMGDGDAKSARETFSLLLLSAAVSGVLVCILGLIFLEPVLRMLGASDLLLPYCREYLFPLLIFAPANILQVLFQNLFVTAGRPALGFWLTLAAGLVNVLFDFILIVPLGMGIRGAALATGLGYLVPTVAGAFFFLRVRKGTLYLCRPRFDLRMLGSICFNGSSELVSQLSAAVTTFLFNTQMMRLLGEDGVAAITIMVYAQFLLTTLYIGFSMGVAPVISYNFGSGNRPQLRRILKICAAVLLAVSLLVFGGSMAGGPALVGIFASQDSRVYEIARAGFLIFPFSFLLCGFNIFTSSLFTALSNGKASAILSFLRTFCFIAIGLLTLPLILRENGVWLAVPIAELVTLLLSAALLWRHRKQWQSS